MGSRAHAHVVSQCPDRRPPGVVVNPDSHDPPQRFEFQTERTWNHGDFLPLDQFQTILSTCYLTCVTLTGHLIYGWSKAVALWDPPGLQSMLGRKHGPLSCDNPGSNIMTHCVGRHSYLRKPRGLLKIRFTWRIDVNTAPKVTVPRLICTPAFTGSSGQRVRFCTLPSSPRPLIPLWRSPRTPSPQGSESSSQDLQTTGRHPSDGVPPSQNRIQT